ncbi:MAG: hypothetical protein JWR42_970 [Marmoricola sp.]|nr:hypothetical protein [Marmoricola sp.]
MRAVVDNTVAWEIQLDRLELEILRAERLIKAMAPLQDPDWEAPDTLGRMPVHLLPRAVAIVERQRAAEATLQRALLQTGREMALAGSLVETGRRPRFVDVSA